MGNITLPESCGGWGLNNLDVFNKEPSLKSLWRGIFGSTLWSRVLAVKYIKEDIINWLRNPIKISRNLSSIWKGFMNVFNSMEKVLRWQVRTGRQIMVGIDPILGMEENYTFSKHILDFLKDKDFSTLDRVKKKIILNGNSYWIRASDLGFTWNGIVTSAVLIL